MTPKRLVLFAAVNFLIAFAALTIGGGVILTAILWSAIGSGIWLQMTRWSTRRALAAVEADRQRERKDARDAANTLVRLAIAQSLAPQFLQRSRPYEQNAELAAMLEAGLLHKAAFVQKPPQLLHFYKRLLFALDRAPTSILEIGVKGGGSTALWKAIFPDARVVGMDLKLRRWLADSGDGVAYVQGDQRDQPRLEQLAAEFGPWDIVIDDGSHVSGDQVISLRTLLPHVRPGGFYVIEDTHSTLKTGRDDGRQDYGADIWPDFVLAMFERRRGGERESPLAHEVGSFIGDMIVGPRVLALRRR